MSRTRGLGFRVYLEGVLLPVQPRSVIVGSSYGGPAQVAIALPPFQHTILLSLKPRTHAVVFWRDLDNPVVDDTSWRLLAEGEITGYRHGKSAAGNLYIDMVVETIDNHWASTYAMTFTSATTLFSSAGSDNRLVFGTQGRVTQVIDTEKRAPLPIETDIQSLVKKQVNVPELFVELLRYVRTVSEFFKTTDDRLHIVDRLAFVPDDEIGVLVEKKKLQTILNKTFSEYPEDGRLLTILKAMLANVSYVYQSVPLPSFVNGGLKQFFLVPEVPFAAPPRCNVFFSGNVSHWEFGRSFLTEPTRARFTSSPLSDEGGQFFETFFAPTQMQALAERILAATEQQKTIDGIILGNEAAPESRENEKGVIPMINQFHAFDTLSIGGDDVAARRKYLCGLVEFELILAQHRTREMTMVMPYNPNAVVGMTGVFIDESAIIFGRVVSVRHTLAAEGSPETQVQMDHCREEDLADLTSPVWKNVRFTNAEKLDATYESFFGQGHASILAPTSVGSAALGTRNSSQIAAAREVRKTYLRSPDQLRFSEEYCARHVATLREFMAFVGANSEGGNFTGGPFRAEWANVGKQIAEALSVHAQDVSR